MATALLTFLFSGKILWATQLGEERVYLGLWLKRDKSSSYQGIMAAGRAESSHLEQQTGSRESKWEWLMAFETSETASSDLLSPAKSHQTYPNRSNNWRPGIHTPETMKDISFKLPQTQDILNLRESSRNSYTVWRDWNCRGQSPQKTPLAVGTELFPTTDMNVVRVGG